uniref:Replicative DNA helicase n=2 Tax=Scytosiphon TaxID=27966 RepID=A0A7T8JJZ0_SCYLO|nr:Replication helicase subunit [Scytosiphon promiscuus]YP_010147388.1 DNA replication helicase [Scytosiphon lomentaria]QDM58288.1 Replication helicase subunit [Scytosiphon promiscuus]QDM58431.1 Replication helicase subunit [Scytosiphon promiscuus]QQP22244.1 DNA replication helicase [Scytosiphon lomentaria]QTW91448.1 replication helicase subunit [Scytosiphon lomentaria]WAM64526.1 Replication helicase subunit [Scytosiphon lomentaria]
MSNLESLDVDSVLPYNLLAEKLVLGSILTIPEAILLVSEKLPIEAFYLDTHQIIYKALLILYAEGKTIDYINLITWIQDNGFLLKIGGANILLDLLNQINRLTNLEEYIALIYEKYLRRSLIKLGEEIIENGYLTEIPLETIFTKIEQSFFLLSENKSRQHLISVEQGLQQILKEIEEGLRVPRLPGLKTTFIEFDIITQGFQNSDLIIIAGRPSMGKTAFAFNLAKNIAQNHNTGVVFFSLEMTRQQLLYRLLASEVEITNTRLRASRIKETEWLKINATIQELSNLKLFIDDTPDLSVGEIKLKIKTIDLESSKHVSLIVIDYLQLLEGMEQNSNRVQELSKITRDLKKLARDLNLPIIVLSQLSRNVESRVNKKPILADLRESGCINFSSSRYIKKIKDKKRTFIFCWTGNFIVKQKILNIKLTGQKPIYKLESNLGWALLLTSNHKILTNKGWKKTDQLIRNNFISAKLLLGIKSLNNSNKYSITWEKVNKISYYELAPVYDLHISNYSNYLTNHLVIHNSIEQDADIVIMLYREDYYNKETIEKNIIELIIAKHRNGPIGSTKLIFDPKYLRFFNL